jgi:DNA-binding transcriptional LysR family regulator
MSQPLYSHELLRTLITVVDKGSLAKAAAILNQTQPAISLQIKRLEEHANQALFEKLGRQLHPTQAGLTLAEYARKIIALNLEAANALNGHQIDGRLRLGVPQDFAEEHLPDVLRRFSSTHPRIHLEVRVERNQQLVKGIASDEYDIAVTQVDKDFQWNVEQKSQLHLLGQEPLLWLASTGFHHDSDALPLVLLEPPCMFRSRAIDALDTAKIKYRIAYITSSLAGVRAAVEGGLGITARLASKQDQTKRMTRISITGDKRLPKLGTLKTYLFKSMTKKSRASETLFELIREPR